MSLTPPAIVWIFDSGAEGPFPISLYSLLSVAQSYCEKVPLIVIDCGISEALRAWLVNLRRPHVHIVKATLPAASSIIGVAPSPAAFVVRHRIDLPVLLFDLMNQGLIPRFQHFLQLDTDTAFLKDPTHLLYSQWSGEDIRCCYEWDWVGAPENDIQSFMKLVRPSTFISQDYALQLAHFADALNMTQGELHCVPTVSSGAWMASVGSSLAEKWAFSYDRLKTIDKKFDVGYLAPFLAEQNALSIAVYKGEILARLMPRSFNCLPPREPHKWPATTVIAHFVTFRKNWLRPAFRLWSQLRIEALQLGFAPPELLMPDMRDP